MLSVVLMAVSVVGGSISAELLKAVADGVMTGLSGGGGITDARSSTKMRDASTALLRASQNVGWTSRQNQRGATLGVSNSLIVWLTRLSAGRSGCRRARNQFGRDQVSRRG